MSGAIATGAETDAATSSPAEGTVELVGVHEMAAQQSTADMTTADVALLLAALEAEARQKWAETDAWLQTFGKRLYDVEQKLPAVLDAIAASFGKIEAALGPELASVTATGDGVLGWLKRVIDHRFAESTEQQPSASAIAAVPAAKLHSAQGG